MARNVAAVQTIHQIAVISDLETREMELSIALKLLLWTAQKKMDENVKPTGQGIKRYSNLCDWLGHTWLVNVSHLQSPRIAFLVPKIYRLWL